MDLIFLHVTTYALSSTVLPVVQRARVPVIILNLSPEAAIDYAAFNRMDDRAAMTGEWLAHCSACPVPEIANVFNRARIPFHQITGNCMAMTPCWAEASEWIEAARVASVMAHNRLGLMGHYYCGMLDIYSDLTQHCAHFGGHMEIIEVDELAALRRDVTAEEIANRVRHFHEKFDVQPDCSPEELERAARTSVALDWLVGRHQLGSMAYYYMGTGNAENEDAISSIILGNSLLTARGIPVAARYEVKNAQAMKIMDTFGAGGSFTEYYAMDLKEDVVLMGHDGPGHIGIAEGKTKDAPAESLSRQSWPRAFRRDVRQAWAGDLALGRPNGRGSAEIPGRRGRIGVRVPSWKSATPTAATDSASARGVSWTNGTPRARPIIARSASATSPEKSRSSAGCCGWRP